MEYEVKEYDDWIAAKLIAIDEAINVITQYHTPKKGLVWENETHQVIRYLENLRNEIIEKRS